MRIGMTWRVWRMAVLLLVFSAMPLSAQDAPPPLTPEQARAAEAAMTRLRSPVTPAHTVDMCPSVGPLRDSIRVAAATGMSADELVEDVIARHGEHLRVLPKRSGAGLVAWLATPLLLLIGGGLIFARIRRDGADAAADPDHPPESEITDEERARLETAMRRFEDTGGLEP